MDIFLLIGHTVFILTSRTVTSSSLLFAMARGNTDDSTSTSLNQVPEVPTNALVHLLQAARVSPHDLAAALREAGVEATFPPLPPPAGPARPGLPIGVGPAGQAQPNLFPLPGASFTPVRGPADGSITARVGGEPVHGHSSTPANGCHQVPPTQDLSPIVQVNQSLPSLESVLSSETGRAFNSALTRALLLSQTQLSRSHPEVFL